MGIKLTILPSCRASATKILKTSSWATDTGRILSKDLIMRVCTRLWRQLWKNALKISSRFNRRPGLSGFAGFSRWPMIVLRTPKGWTAPAEVDGHKLEGFWRAHQVPIADVAKNPAHLKLLEDWMRSYRPEELFDETGKLISELAELAPVGPRRMGANPHANGGLLLKDLLLPDFRDYEVEVPAPGTALAEATRLMGRLLRHA